MHTCCASCCWGGAACKPALLGVASSGCGCWGEAAADDSLLRSWREAASGEGLPCSEASLKCSACDLMPGDGSSARLTSHSAARPACSEPCPEAFLLRSAAGSPGLLLLCAACAAGAGLVAASGKAARLSSASLLRSAGRSGSGGLSVSLPTTAGAAVKARSGLGLGSSGAEGAVDDSAGVGPSESLRRERLRDSLARILLNSSLTGVRLGAAAGSDVSDVFLQQTLHE